MVWFSSLLHRQCGLCGKHAVLRQNACRECSRTSFQWQPQLRTLSLDTHVETLKQIPLCHLGLFEGPWREQILLQKTSPSERFTKLSAQALASTFPSAWHSAKLLWVPARAFQDTHLVEQLALSFAKLGVQTYPKPAIRRSIFLTTKQKELRLEERKTSRGRFVSTKYAPKALEQTRPPVLLLDDVVTSGSTLRDCAELAQNTLQLNVIGAVSLAYTELK